ncbi:MAG: YraN family protein [Deltaproteobacteria bacterium]|nr:YraN family protein [Deltaproteobacteria bacterium]
MRSTLKRRGDIGEKLAFRYLEAKGYKILALNWRCFAGELDIVASDGDEMVFCEVKSLHADYPDYDPCSRIDRRKIKKLKELARHYRETHWRTIKLLRLWNYRFDMIGVCITSSGSTVHHTEDAFS